MQDQAMITSMVIFSPFQEEFRDKFEKRWVHFEISDRDRLTNIDRPEAPEAESSQSTRAERGT